MRMSIMFKLVVTFAIIIIIPIVVMAFLSIWIKFRGIEDVVSIISIGGFISFVLAIIIGFIVARSLTKPIDAIIKAFESLSVGDLDIKVDVNTIKQRDEIYELAKAFNQMGSELKKNIEQQIAARASSEAKNHFLANVSHEIRTPLNAIVGLVGLIIKTDLTAKQHDYIEKIQSCAQMLISLVNDIVDFSKIESGKVEIEQVEFSLNTLMDTIADMFSSKAAEKKLEFIISISMAAPRALIGDYTKLTQILANLTNNAIKFTEKGEVFIKVDWVKKYTEKVLLKFIVKDTGIGISEEDKKNLFASFSNVNRLMNNKYSGTGLGLHICKKFIELMSGSINVESLVNEGSTFTFIVELGRQPEEKEPKFVLPFKLQEMMVLILDYNENSRKVLKEGLESFLADTHVVNSETELLSQISKHENSYKLIVLDWKIEEHGVDFLKKIRKLTKIPIIITTRTRRETDVLQAEAAGVNAFLTKPVKQSLLFEAIMEIFDFKVLKNQDETVKIEDKIKTAKLLIAENDLTSQKILKETLASSGISVDSANNGKEALEIIVKSSRDNMYDAVLMALQMPIMDGFESTKLIRDCKIDVPVIAMTANSLSKEDKDKCLFIGINDFLTKPINAGYLYLTLAKWIKKASLFEAKTKINTNQDDYDFDIILPGVDTKSGLERLNGNKKLFIKLLKQFMKDYSNSSNQIKLELQKNRIDSAIRISNSLKGIAADFSANYLYESASELEIGLKKNSNNINELFDAIENSLNQLFEAIRSIDTLQPKTSVRYSKNTQIDPQEIMPIIVELEGLLSKNSPKAEDCVEILKNNLELSQEFQKQIRQLESQVSRFDFRYAQETLSEIAYTLGIFVKPR